MNYRPVPHINKHQLMKYFRYIVLILGSLFAAFAGGSYIVVAIHEAIAGRLPLGIALIVIGGSTICLLGGLAICLTCVIRIRVLLSSRKAIQ